MGGTQSRKIKKNMSRILNNKNSKEYDTDKNKTDNLYLVGNNQFHDMKNNKNHQKTKIFKITYVVISLVSFGGMLIITSLAFNFFKIYFLTVQGLMMDIAGSILIVLPILHNLPEGRWMVKEVNRDSVILGIIILVIGFTLQIIATILKEIGN